MLSLNLFAQDEESEYLRALRLSCEKQKVALGCFNYANALSRAEKDELAEKYYALGCKQEHAPSCKKEKWDLPEAEKPATESAAKPAEEPATGPAAEPEADIESVELDLDTGNTINE